MNKKLIAKAILSLSITFIPLQTTNAGIPVIDTAHIYFSSLDLIESAAQTLKQIEEYATQLQQYETQLKNTLGATSFVWDSAVTTISKLNETVDTLDHYKTSLGSIDAYIDKYKDIDYYKVHPCFTGGAGCTASLKAELKQAREFASGSIRKANEAVMRSIDIQQQNLHTEAEKLIQIQTSATSVEGQLQAIQVANQLAASQANQLLQLRSLFIAQNTATTAKYQGEEDLKAQEAAAAESLREGNYSPSPTVVW